MTNTSTTRTELCRTRLLTIALLVGLLALLSLSVVGQGVITTLSGGNSTFTYYDSGVDLNAVIAAASANDTIILPGGPLPMNATITVDKPIVLIGAGYHAQGSLVTGPTVIPAGTGPFALNIIFQVSEGADGSSFHGIRFDRDLGHFGDVGSISFNRCEFNRAFSLTGIGAPFQMPSATNVMIEECIFHQTIVNGMNGGVLGLNIYNSILDGGVNAGSGISGALIDHCTILGPGLGGDVNEGLTYDHCVITKASGALTITEPACFQNCLFVLGNSTTVNPGQCYVGQGNDVLNASAASPDFENVPIGELEQFSLAHDYHFAPGSLGLTMDVGIYGGTFQFKPQGIPFNPHWESLTVPPQTQGGLLSPVVISGTAQPN